MIIGNYSQTDLPKVGDTAWLFGIEVLIIEVIQDCLETPEGREPSPMVRFAYWTTTQIWQKDFFVTEQIALLKKIGQESPKW